MFEFQAVPSIVYALARVKQLNWSLRNECQSKELTAALEYLSTVNSVTVAIDGNTNAPMARIEHVLVVALVAVHPLLE